MRFGIGTIALGVTGILGALMLLPSDGSSVASTPRTSALATSPKLASFLESAVSTRPASRTSAQVLADVAAAPEPVAARTLLAPAAGVSATPAIAVADAGNPVPHETTRVRSSVNMRSGPSTDHATLSVLQADTEVTIVAMDGGWARIETGDGASGWVYSRYLGIGPAADEEPIREASAAIAEDSVTAGANFRLRADPTTFSGTVATVPAGTQLTIAGQRGGWLNVILPDGTSGWVRGSV